VAPGQQRDRDTHRDYAVPGAGAPGLGARYDAGVDRQPELSEFESEMPGILELLRTSNCTRIPSQHLLVPHFRVEESIMKYFLDSLGWTVFWGVVLTLVLYNIVKFALQ
jgi:hypothetical protein